ncbi:CLUMA_CG012911, isoform A [Clunio marinus]|uniref:CLUMA_CG012911, isoform A n=1 Tax=Clunio marinus TaxID=568069 RepID=A0A1J1IH60_9DIPT|nr:CLUMA_CG012911, isoform A [Clunio marinus]
MYDYDLLHKIHGNLLTKWDLNRLSILTSKGEQEQSYFQPFPFFNAKATQFIKIYTSIHLSASLFPGQAIQEE